MPEKVPGSLKDLKVWLDVGKGMVALYDARHCLDLFVKDGEIVIECYEGDKLLKTTSVKEGRDLGSLADLLAVEDGKLKVVLK